MKYRFIAACPRCRKTREVEFRRPEKPCLSCGDRLMDNIEISVTRVQRWPIPSDTERDDRDSEKLIAAFDRATQRLRSDYERDEIDTAKQLSGLDAAIEELRMANRPPPRSLSDAQWDDIDSQKQIETFRSKRKRNQSDPASQGQTQRWPIITDTERDLRDGTYKTAAATYAANAGNPSDYAKYVARRQAADTLCQATQDNAKDSVRGTYLAR